MDSAILLPLIIKTQWLARMTTGWRQSSGNMQWWLNSMGLPSILQRSKINAWWTHCAALHHTWLVVHNHSSSTIWGIMQAAGKTLRTIYWIAEASYKTGIIYEIQGRRIQVVVSCDNRMQMIHDPMQWEGDTHTHSQKQQWISARVSSKKIFAASWSTLFFDNLFSRVICGPRKRSSFT